MEVVEGMEKLCRDVVGEDIMGHELVLRMGLVFFKIVFDLLDLDLRVISLMLGFIMEIFGVICYNFQIIVNLYFIFFFVEEVSFDFLLLMNKTVVN
jgi:hypothetical protein